MDNSILEMKDHLKEKEETINALVKDYKSAVETSTVLQCEVMDLSDDCTLKQKQHGDIEDLVKEESKDILAIIGAYGNSVCDRPLQRLELASAMMHQSLEKLTAIEDMAPSAVDEQNLQGILDGLTEKLYSLDRQSNEKRSQLQEGSREQIFSHQDMKEQTQTLTDILLEMAELKKEEEARDARTHQMVVNKISSNLQLKKKLQRKRSLKNE